MSHFSLPTLERFSDEKNLQGHPLLSETNNSVDTVILDTLEDPTIAKTLFSH